LHKLKKHNIDDKEFILGDNLFDPQLRFLQKYREANHFGDNECFVLKKFESGYSKIIWFVTKLIKKFDIK